MVDTSVWADHFRSGDAALAALLQNEEILQHPFVTGELAMGNPRDRHAMVATLNAIPQAPVTGWAELLDFLDAYHLAGTGLGYIDAHLLAASRSSGVRLWSKDKRLASQAGRLGLAYST